VQLTFFDLQKCITAQHVTIINSVKFNYFSMSFVILGVKVQNPTENTKKYPKPNKKFRTPPNKKPVRPADGFLKTAKIGSEKNLE